MGLPMPAPEPMPPDAPDTGAPPAGASDYAKAGRTIRHAIADGDDEALGQAVCDLIDIHTSREPEPAKKPNLALILAQGRKGKK